LDGRPAQLSILSARGLGCLLLVAFHVVGSTPQGGLRLPESSGWHYAMVSVEFLRMPLFSVLSGYLYAMRRPTRETLRAFAWGKVRRIVLPLIFATLVTFWLRAANYGSDVTLAYALSHHYEHFWFLQALLLIFIFMAACDVVQPPGWRLLLIFSCIALLLERSFELTDLFSLNGAVYLLPFFCFGMILQLEPNLLARIDVRIFAALVFVVVIAAQQSGLLFGTAAVLRESFPAAMAGFAISLLMLVYLPSLPLLEIIGRYSYGIYIWHSICAAAVRTWLNAAIPLSTTTQFLIVLTAGILLPMGLQLLVDGFPLLPTLMMGKKTASRR
jgi:surface polysaccharide O-acyltransferase-like enzyme